jgi:hypothetical protein
MSRHSRRWLLAVLALTALAVLGIVAFLVFAQDSLEAARRRVPLGADEEAVAQAVGRRADGRVGLAGKTAEVTRFALARWCWSSPTTKGATW